ncbi:exported hypothetical protein [Rhodospirillaceae bacterium LM-1]|nr:exported hypothetical protein [Rhodospirillaceae bacterium LM-1]
MKRQILSLSLFGLTCLTTPALACGGNADLNPGAPPFAPSREIVNQEHLLKVTFSRINPLFKLQAGKSGFVRLGFLAPDDKWEIRHSSEWGWGDIFKPIDNQHMSLRATREGDEIILHLTGKSEGQSSFQLAYLPQKGSPAYGPSKRLSTMPIMVAVTPAYVFVPRVMTLEGDVDAQSASVDGASSFIVRLPTAADGYRWEVVDALQTSSDPSAKTQAPWQPLGVAPKRLENGDFHVGTPSYGTMKVVFALKDRETGVASNSITVALRVNPRPLC